MRRGPASRLPTRAVPTLLFVTLCNWNKIIRIMKIHLSVRQTLEETSFVKKFYFKNDLQNEADRKLDEANKKLY